MELPVVLINRVVWHDVVASLKWGEAMLPDDTITHQIERFSWTEFGCLLGENVR